MTVLKARIGGQWVPLTGDKADRWFGAWGTLQRSFKASTEGGFGSTEYGISGIGASVPNVSGRLYQVEFGLRLVPSTLPPADNSVIVVNLRAGSLTGAIARALQFTFPVHTTPYGWDLIGVFPPLALTPGQGYILSTSTDGTGRYQITDQSWSTLIDVGPQAGYAPQPSAPSAWLPLVFQGSWSNYGSGFQPGQYRMVGDEVQLRGLVKVTGTDLLITNLPIGFRPATHNILDGWAGKGTTYGTTRVEVYSNGNVQPSAAYGYPGMAPPLDHLTLDNVRFSISA